MQDRNTACQQDNLKHMSLEEQSKDHPAASQQTERREGNCICAKHSDMITLDQRQMWRHLLAACSGTLDREGGLDHRGGTREDQKLSPPGCVLQLRRVGRRPLTCEDVGEKKKR